MDADLSLAVVKACAGFLIGLFAWMAAGAPLAWLLGRYIFNNGLHHSEIEQDPEPEPDFDFALLEAELEMAFPKPAALAA